MGLETLAIASIAASAVGTGVSAYSASQAGKAQQSLANYNASVTQSAADYNASQIEAAGSYNADLTLKTAETNASIVDRNAARTLATGDYNARVDEQNAGAALVDSATMANIQRLNNAHILANQRAKFGASGVVGGTGSPLIVQAAQAGYAEMAALQTERAGAVKSQAFLQQAMTERWQAGEDATALKLEAATIRTNAKNEAAATLWQAGENAKMTRYTGRTQSQLDVMGGNAAARAGNLAAAGTILQGAAKTTGQAYGYYGGGG